MGYEQVSDKDIVFFLGNTGVGKTTAINYIGGRKMAMKTVTVEYELVIVCEDPIEGFSIGMWYLLLMVVEVSKSIHIWYKSNRT